MSVIPKVIVQTGHSWSLLRSPKTIYPKGTKYQGTGFQPNRKLSEKGSVYGYGMEYNGGIDCGSLEMK